MLLVSLIELKKDKKMWDLLKYNSYWIKNLNRNPDNIKLYKENMKVKYKLRMTDIISNVLQVLK